VIVLQEGTARTEEELRKQLREGRNGSYRKGKEELLIG